MLLLFPWFVLSANAAANWTEKNPASHPSPRASAAASIGGDQVLLFGGFIDSNVDDETWVYDLSDNTWTQQTPVTHPPKMEFHALAYIGDDKALLFGGTDIGVLYDQTWIYDLSDNTWTQQSVTTHPAARFSHGMSHIEGDKVLLFGGFAFDDIDDTWVYDLSDNTWTEQTPIVHPSARSHFALASVGGDRGLLFGGFDGGDFFDETWIYDLSDGNWTQQSPTTSPSDRSTFGATLGGDQTIIFGEESEFPGGTLDETWIYDLSDNNWTQQAPATHPSGRHIAAIAQIAGNTVLLFGGVADPFALNDETWVFEFSSSSAIDVPVDVKPGGCPNQLKGSGNGKANVSILGTAAFDVSQVDPESVRLEGVTPVRWSLGDEGSPFTPFTGKSDCNADCLEGGPDLFPDLNLKFNKDEILGALETVSAGECIVLHLTGELFDGTPIQGEDVVIISLR